MKKLIPFLIILFFTTLSFAGQSAYTTAEMDAAFDMVYDWEDGSAAIDGDEIADDTIDDDSIDFGDITCVDLTMSDCGAVTASGFTIGSAGIDETELEILDGALLSTTQINYLQSATGTTGTASTNLVFSTLPTITTPTFVTSITMGSAALNEAELEIIDGGLLTTTQLNYLQSATGTTGTATTNLVFSASPTLTGTAVVAAIDGSGTISANLFTPDGADGADIGSTTLYFSDAFFADGSILYFGDDQDVNLTHVADTGLTTNLNLTAATLTSSGALTISAGALTDNTVTSDDIHWAEPITVPFDNKLQFGDTGIYIWADDDGVLDIVSDTTIESSAAWAHTGNFTATTYGAASVTDTELGYLDTVSSNIQTQLDNITPGTGTDEMLTRWSTANGLQDSGVTLDDTDNMSGLASLDLDAQNVPTSTFNDLGATDTYAGSILMDMTDVTQTAEITDINIKAQISGADSIVAEWDGSDEAWIFGDSGTGEDLKVDFENAANNLVIVGTNSGVTAIDFGTINLATDELDLSGGSITNLAAGGLPTDVITMDEIDADGAFTSLTGAWATTGLLSGGVKTVVDANPADGEIDAYCYGGVFFASGTGTAVLPAVAVGMQVTVENHTADDVWIDPDASEVIRLNGVALTGGHRILGTDLGDGCVLTYYSAGVWSAFCSGYATAGS